MKIEFRKVPIQGSEFEIAIDSAIFSGTFSKISSKLVKIEGKLAGKLDVDCCKCGKTITIDLDEETNLLVSDGIYKSDTEEEFVVIEVEDSIIDFEDIFRSEIESIKSEYYQCDECSDNSLLVDVEY